MDKEDRFTDGYNKRFLICVSLIKSRNDLQRYYVIYFWFDMVKRTPFLTKRKVSQNESTSNCKKRVKHQPTQFKLQYILTSLKLFTMTWRQRLTPLRVRSVWHLIHHMTRYFRNVRDTNLEWNQRITAVLCQNNISGRTPPLRCDWLTIQPLETRGSNMKRTSL